MLPRARLPGSLLLCSRPGCGASDGSLSPSLSLGFLHHHRHHNQGILQDLPGQVPGTQEVPATGSPKDSCSWPQARSAPCSNLACQSHPDSSGSIEAERHAAGSPNTHAPQPGSPQMYFLPQHQQGDTSWGRSSHMGPSPQMNTHTDVCAHPATGSSLAQRSPLGLVALGALVQPPPLAACLPAATFAQLCLVFSCLPSFGGRWYVGL